MWWVIGIGGPVLAAAAFFFAWRGERARREADAQRARAMKAEDALAVERESGGDDKRRLEAVIRVLRVENQASSRRMADLVRGNPQLAREYLRSVFAEADHPPTHPLYGGDTPGNLATGATRGGG